MRTRTCMAAAAAVLLVLTTGGQAGAAQPGGPQVYEVTGAATAQERTEVARTGADILDAERRDDHGHRQPRRSGSAARARASASRRSAR